MLRISGLSKFNSDCELTGNISRKHDYKLSNYKLVRVGRDRVVGTAIRYGLDGSETETRWRRDIPNPPRTALEPTQPPVRRVAGLFWG